MFKTAFLLAIIGVLAALAAAARLPPKDIDPCSERKKIGPCKSDPKEKRFFYNSTSLECERFGWGGCEPNGNNFETKRACERTCVVKGRGCVHEGVWYRDGAVISEDPCKPCHCSDGTVACAIVDCFAKCKNPIYVPGQCCPVCQPDDSCVVDGITYENGAEIETEDPCEWCSCFEGEKICAYMKCAYCYNPIWVEGQCCPQCSDSCVVDGITYENGAEIKTEDPCEWCSCYDGEKMCAVMGCAYCLNPIFVEGQCCPQCGEFWYDDWLTPPQTSPPPTTRPPPTTTEEHTAPPPPYNCIRDGITYPEGNYVQTNDPCEWCSCERGELMCIHALCMYCENPVPVAGQCCPECNDNCIRDGITYPEGEYVQTNDPCEYCSCQQGELMCAIMDCMVCQNPVWSPGQCCPECYDNAWWTPTTTPSPTTFPPTTTTPDSTPPPPTTPEGPTTLSNCMSDGITYPEGNEIQSPNDPCMWCSCRRGKLMCVYQDCMYCQHPVWVPGRCCPECNDDAWTPMYTDTTAPPPTTATTTPGLIGYTWDDIYGWRSTRPPTPPTTTPGPIGDTWEDLYGWRSTSPPPTTTEEHTAPPPTTTPYNAWNPWGIPGYEEHTAPPPTTSPQPYP